MKCKACHSTGDTITHSIKASDGTVLRQIKVCSLCARTLTQVEQARNFTERFYSVHPIRPIRIGTR